MIPPVISDDMMWHITFEMLDIHIFVDELFPDFFSQRETATIVNVSTPSVNAP